MIERQLRMPGVVAHRSGTLLERDVTVVGNIPVTTVARTLVDLSSRFDDDRLARAFDETLRAGVVSLSAVRETITRLPGIAPGRSPSRIHRILSARIPGYDPGDSELETRVWEVAAAAGLPLPVRRFQLRGPTRSFVIDLAYPAERIAIEVDGFDPHRTRTAFDADRARQNLLSLLDWLILRFTSRSTDTEIVDTITHALSRPGVQ